MWLARQLLHNGSAALLIVSALACGAPRSGSTGSAGGVASATAEPDLRSRCHGAEHPCALPDGRVGWCEVAPGAGAAAPGRCADVCGGGRSYSSLDTDCHSSCDPACEGHCREGLCFAGAAPAAAADVGAVAPAGPVAVALGSEKLRGLPAISTDGTQVAIALQVRDGARGEANLTLVVLEVATDRAIRQLTIVDPLAPDAPGLEARIRGAADVLAERRWIPLRALVTDVDVGAPARPIPGGDRTATLARDDRGMVRFREPLLEVIEGGGRSSRRKVPTWSKPSGPRCHGCPDCPAPLAEIARAFIDEAQRTVLAVVSYHGGTDSCWEPDETVHVVWLR